MNKTELALENKSLEYLEAEIWKLWSQYSEEFFKLGTMLMLIKEGKYEEAGCGSWTEYCNSGRLPGVGRTQATNLIGAAIVRPYLPKLPKPAGQVTNVTDWTEWNVRPFVRAWKTGEYEVREFKAFARDVVKDFAKSQRSEKPEALSKIATRWVDNETVKSQETKTRMQKHIEYLQNRIEKHETLELLVSDQIDCTKVLHNSLKKLPADTWDEVPIELMKQYPAALRALADFIESE